MKKIISLLVVLSLLWTSCNHKMVGVVSTSEPRTIWTEREVVGADGYRIKSSESFDVTLEKYERVSYKTEVTEIQRWTNPNRYTTYPILSGLFGWTAVSAYDAHINGFDVDGKIEHLDIAWPIVFGAISLGCFIGIFGKWAYKKNVTKRSAPLIRNEWGLSKNDNFTVGILNQQNSFWSDDKGKITIDPYKYKFPVLTEHKDFKVNFSSRRFPDFGNATINSSWWMKEYGVINSDPVKIYSSFNPPVVFSPTGQRGVGSHIYENRQDYSLLKVKNNNSWISPKFLNIFYYSSPKEIGNIPALKSINYGDNEDEIIEKQKQIIENEINN